MQKLSNKEKQAENPQNISSILDKCTIIEKYTQKKYKELSKQTDNERAQTLFERLSRAGEAHAILLTEMKKHLNLESDFKETYKKLSEEVKNPRAQELFRTLIIDETNHHRELVDLIKAFQEVHKLIFEIPLK